MTNIEIKQPALLLNLSQKRREKPAYNLIVTAENSLASPKLLSSANLRVIVYDVSDQRPQFAKSEYEIEVSESVAPGTSVIQINVTNSEQVFEITTSYKNKMLGVCLWDLTGIKSNSIFVSGRLKVCVHNLVRWKQRGLKKICDRTWEGNYHNTRTTRQRNSF